MSDLDKTNKEYVELLAQVKTRIQSAQARAALSANAEMIGMYWDIGRMIHERQEREGWGAGVIPRLAVDLRNDFPEQKGFSERNIGRMIAFYREYAADDYFLPQPVAKLPGSKNEVAPEDPLLTDLHDAQRLAAQLPWGHNILLLEKVKDKPTRMWYMAQTIAHGWPRAALSQMLKNQVHERQGAAVTNFKQHLPEAHAELARKTLKSPYIFDFLTIDQPLRERKLELDLVKHLEEFLLELGQGFAFVGRQYHLSVGEQDYYLDLLFYHLNLRCFVVVDLKIGEFKPEFAGKMNFYCNAVDEQLRHDGDNPTIGLILCQDNEQIIAEYTLRGMSQPIGVSEYDLTKALPEDLKSSLPSIEQLEAEFEQDLEEDNG